MQNPFDKYKTQQMEQASKPKKAPKKVRAATKKTRVRPKKKAAKVNPMVVLLSSLVLLLSLAVLNDPKQFLEWSGGIEIGFNSVNAAEQEKKSTEKSKKEEEVAALPVGSFSGRKTDAKSLTMKNASVFDALKNKERELEKKERRLARLEEDLQKQKKEIEKQLKELKGIQRNISSKLDKKVTADEKSVEKLVGVYSSMKPKNAATILSQIDQDLAIKVLGRMKKQSAAAILNFIEPQKARVLSEQYAGLKK